MDDKTIEMYLVKFNITWEQFEMDNDTKGDSDIKQQLIRYYVMGIGGMTVCCLGIIGNILSTIILTRKVMKSSTYIYLASLAVCDSLVLFFTILLLIRDTKYPEKGEPPWTNRHYAQMFPIAHPLAITFQVTSIWLTLSFTVDRYIMICHPFRAERWCSNRRAIKVSISLYLAGIIFTIPRYLEYTTKVINENLTINYWNVSGPPPPVRTRVELTELGKSDLFRETVHSWSYLICVCGLPFLLLAFLNAFLVTAVHISRQKGKEINANERRRNDTTVMLIGVVVIFLICQGPALISRMIWALDIQTATKPSYLIFNEVANFLVIMNSAINIVPYYFFGQKFRKEFWRLFCSCLLNKEELRLLARRLSFSVDNHHRRMSPASFNGNVISHGQNCTQTIQSSHGDYEDSDTRRHSSTPFIDRRIEMNQNYSTHLEIPLNSIHSNCVYKKDTT